MIVRLISTIFLAINFTSCFAGVQAPPSPQDTVTLTVGSCFFSLKDLYNGKITLPRVENDFKFAGYEAAVKATNLDEHFGFYFSCHDNIQSMNDVASKFGGRYDSKKNRWVPDFDDAPKQDIARLRSVTKIFAFNSVNGHGFYTIQDELDGEPYNRMRHISYCLFYEKKGVCGDGQVKRLSDPRSDMLSYALKILRSIEFTDAPPEAGKDTRP
jgi:hypothetical protein